MAERLTYAQHLAVNDRGGNLLVSAAAGSGKTKVLVDRLIKYLTDPVAPANIDDFLIITYTKAAAAELRGKIAAKLSEHIASDPTNRHLQRQMQRLYLTKISTVHAFCADILREYAYRLDIAPDFRVGDENECLQLRNQAMDAALEAAYSTLDKDFDFQAFVDTQGLGRTDALVPEIILQVYESSMCHLNPKLWRKKCIADADISEIHEPLDTLWGRYLADSLFATLDGYIEAFKQCCNKVELLSGMEKPLSLLKNTTLQLQQLRNSATWDEIVHNKNIDYGRLVFPKKLDDPTITEKVKAVRKSCKETLDKKLRCFSDTSERILEDLSQSAPAASGLIALVNKFEENYAKLKTNARVLDFSDLEHRMLDLLWGKSRTSITTVATEISQRFREIMVDEYQDSNGVQDAIFKALTEQKQNLFMVGDVKQSIYQFRLADPGIFLEKYAGYVPAEAARPGEGRKILLSSNFRSSGGVISAVNDVFRDCMSESVGGLLYGEGEALQEGLPHCCIQEPEVELHCIAVTEDTYEEEAEYVAGRIQELLNGNHYVRDGEKLRSIRPEDIVILLRSPGSVGLTYQTALERYGIACAGSVGGDLLLTEEIGTLRSLLQVISNPRQDIPLIAVLASPIFCFTADDLAVLRSMNKNCSMYDAVIRSDLPKVTMFLSVFSELRSAASMLKLPELLDLIFRLTQLDSVYSAMEDGEMRKFNLQSFYQLATNFSAVGSGNLDRFLEHLEAVEDRGIPVSAEQPAGCVTIMSIHKSKGLEFPVVILSGLSRRFNREDLRQQVLCHKELGLGLSCVDHANRVRYPTLSRHAISAKIMAESVSEELRVLYVAMTRARDRLIMTYASQSLEKDIRDTAMTMDISGKLLMTQEVSCPGDWVLYSALRRIEAGTLFAIGGRPDETRVSEAPWKIVVSSVNREESEMNLQMPLPPTAEKVIDMAHLEHIVAFQYAYEPATHTPSKLTATQRKGRIKDQEAADHADEPKPIWRSWRKASFAASAIDGSVYGNAMHAVMQFIRFEACTDAAAIQREIERLVNESFITEKQGEMADCDKLAAFFTSEFGAKLRNSRNVLREFKFSILDNAADYCDGVTEESVLLQGVVDCALIEEDGITIVDFKTDHVSEQTLPEIICLYSPQIETYAGAMSRIFEKPIKRKALYLFAISQFADIK